MKNDPEMVEILSLGLVAMEYVQTASKGDWKRFGKFRYWDREGEGDAYYILPDGKLWYSILRVTMPEVDVTGQPLYQRIFYAGCAAATSDPNLHAALKISQRIAEKKIDADAALRELTGK